MSQKYRWGILATGNIAGSMAQSLVESEEAELLAVASRFEENATRFGERWQVPRRYGSYESLANDPDIDVVYIATPHALHYDNMMLCLEAGKHVLCEKPLTLNAREAAACVELARRKGLFLMEAMWMRFFPAMAQVRQWIGDGVIGEIRHLSADFCFHLPYDPHHRLFNPQLGGGTLLDVGIYPLSLATMVLGFPDQIDGRAVLSPSGVDENIALTLQYDHGALALLNSSLRYDSPREALIAGPRGYIKIHDLFFRPDTLTLHRHGRPAETTKLPFRANGYIHEVEAVHASVQAGRIEHELMPHAETLNMMALMDGLREQWGVIYPTEMK